MTLARHPLFTLGFSCAAVALAAAQAVLVPHPVNTLCLALVALAAPAAVALENVRLRRTARHRGDDLVEARRRRDEFLALLGHELRNPLAPVRNALEVLRLRGSADPPLRALCDVMGRQLLRLTRLVDDLLDASRVTRGRIELRRERVDLGTLVAGAAETARPLARERHQGLEVALPPEPVVLEADPTRLEQVLDNLLQNAVRYTPAGGRVDVSAARWGGEAVLTVRDTGIGIPADMLPHVFDLFVQADRPPGRPAEGLGIGLTLVRGLVELHGGRVEARSDGRDRGSEFTVRLPCPAFTPASEGHTAKTRGGPPGPEAAGARPPARPVPPTG
jgi:signal transduction histidine kinase